MLLGPGEKPTQPVPSGRKTEHNRMTEAQRSSDEPSPM
jgi:hypothetical protein